MSRRVWGSSIAIAEPLGARGGFSRDYGGGNVYPRNANYGFDFRRGESGHAQRCLHEFG